MNNQLLLFEAVTFLGLPADTLEKKVVKLPQLPGRLEIFDGVNGNLIIDDTYNIDIDALDQALEFLMSSKEKEKKMVILEMKGLELFQKNKVKSLVESYKLKSFILLENNQIVEKKRVFDEPYDFPTLLQEIEDCAILIKGPFHSTVNQWVQLLKKKSHESHLSFDMKAIKHNLNHFRKIIPSETKLLVMVKAAAYGAGEIKIPHFLQENGVDYLGVAYADEGVLLRRNNIHLPIIVMNTEVDAFSDIIRFDLEPAIYSKEILRYFIQYLDQKNIDNHPVHIKVDTGMNRLGFQKSEIPELIGQLKEAKLIQVKSVFTHLSNSDDINSDFSEKQLCEFEAIRNAFQKNLNNEIAFHALNSEGILRFAPNYTFNMVRLGIGLFGYSQFKSAAERLLPAVAWKTTLSQIKTIKSGETVGYGRTYTAMEDMTIGVIRVGYADGFSRRLSNGVGQVYLNGLPCKVIGSVCMDMTMINLSGVNCKLGDEVEIFGSVQSIQDFAKKLDTIPYEVLTTISKRVWRKYQM